LLEISLPAHTQRITQEAVDVSFRNGHYRGTIEVHTVVMSPGAHSTGRQTTLYRGIGKSLTEWTSATRTWTCLYPVRPIAPPPLTVDLSARGLRASVGARTTVNGVSVWPITVRASGQTASLYVGRVSSLLIQEVSSYLTPTGKIRAPTLERVNYSRYGEPVPVTLPITCPGR
jgi:hypothetical protein